MNVCCLTRESSRAAVSSRDSTLASIESTRASLELIHVRCSLIYMQVSIFFPSFFLVSSFFPVIIRFLFIREALVCCFNVHRQLAGNIKQSSHNNIDARFTNMI